MNTKDFAKICGVEKRTLFYYDEIGLLKPARILENGYRDYDLIQIEQMDNIKIYQSCGCSLTEIKEHMNLDLEGRYQYLKKSIKLLEEKINELSSIKEYLNRRDELYRQYHNEYKPELKHLNFKYDKKEILVHPHFFSYTCDGLYNSMILNCTDNSYFIYKIEENGSENIEGDFFIFFTEGPTVCNLFSLVKSEIHKYGYDADIFYIEFLTHILSEDGKSVIKVYALLK